MEIFPVGTVAAITTPVVDVISDNIVVIVGVLGFFVAIKIASRLLNGATKGKARL